MTDDFSIAYELDNGGWAVKHNGITLFKGEVIGLLEEQSKRIEELEIQTDIIDYLRKENKRLYDENCVLNEEKIAWKHKYNELKQDWDYMVKE